MNKTLVPIALNATDIQKLSELQNITQQNQTDSIIFAITLTLFYWHYDSCASCVQNTWNWKKYGGGGK